jgi:hypothetical protein
LKSGGHKFLGEVPGFPMEVLSDRACWGLRHECIVVKVCGMHFKFIVVIEVPDVQFPEYVLHGDKAIVFLPHDVGLRLFDIIVGVPDVDGVLVADYQPHLIYIKSIKIYQLEGVDGG